MEKYNSQEDYVDIEIAQLLNERGFDIPCRAAYIWNQGYDLCTLFSKPLYFNREGGLDDYEDMSVPRISAPTLQVAVKWVYETYKIHIQPEIYYCEDGMSWLVKIFKVEPYNTTSIKTILPNNTKQDAIEKALKYVLANG